MYELNFKKKHVPVLYWNKLFSIILDDKRLVVEIPRETGTKRVSLKSI